MVFRMYSFLSSKANRHKLNIYLLPLVVSATSFMTMASHNILRSQFLHFHKIRLRFHDFQGLCLLHTVWMA